MSAKEHYQKPPQRDLPELPPELWREIMQFAIFVPDLCSLQVAPSYQMSDAERRTLKEFKKSLVTRRYLVRVCKEWLAMASPFLYESVIIGRHRGLQGLQAALDHPTPGNETCRFGWWTKRLDVAMRDSVDRKTFEPIMVQLVSIIRLLPNLEILNFRITGHGYHRKTCPHEVLQACSTSLKSLSWQTEILQPIYDKDLWWKFLGAHLGIQTLKVMSGADFDPLAVVDGRNIILPGLKTLYLWSSLFSEPDSRWSHRFPNVNDATITSNAYSAIHFMLYASGPGTTDSTGSGVIKQFQSQFLPQLKTLRVEMAFNHLSMIPSHILPYCTRLTTLYIIVFDPTEEILVHLPSTVTKVVIERHIKKYSKYEFIELFDTLRKFVDRNPHIKQIQFLDSGNIGLLRAQPKILQKFRDTFGKLSVEMVDYDERAVDPSA